MKPLLFLLAALVLAVLFTVGRHTFDADTPESPSKPPVTVSWPDLPAPPVFTVQTTSTTAAPTTTTHTHPVAVARSAPKQVRASGPGAWYRLAQCESGGNWAISDRHHSGGLQFAWGTWNTYRPEGFPRYAHEASPDQQIVVGKLVLRAQGVRAWPVCGPRVGLTMADAT